ncbi:hypothetical protein [Aquibacillus rhizosphaerae]|uniref:GapA-binding peptide SR1P n=1 Tax=Aquibacillus rhizosphaerae TaxID=3051431 RepID=A0ABT7LB43_9BACI|nr:hypothetical protein [Aquibacillus sp. LR5S19]MDL4843088.1 hypothetical protein [Aquibacillus sp. LR5S19]
MEEIEEQRFCNQCRRKTNHIVSEDALAIVYKCKECNSEEEVVKTFF